jgi:indolepyruvate ferredoxin oxidoreductase
LGIDDALAAEIGIRLYKVGMVWPLESEGVRRFAEGLEEILVVEEKRQLIEVPVEGGTLQLARRRAPARDRQVRRERRMGAAAWSLAAAGRRRACRRRKSPA